MLLAYLGGWKQGDPKDRAEQFFNEDYSEKRKEQKKWG
jgi:hypothetical protein